MSQYKENKTRTDIVSLSDGRGKKQRSKENHVAFRFVVTKAGAYYKLGRVPRPAMSH